jgi:hypothetical protein
LGIVDNAVQGQEEKAEKEAVTPPLIQIAGLQRSGTRWVTMLLRDNFALTIRSHHKHEGPNNVYWNVSPRPTHTFIQDLQAESARAIVVRKHFDKWVESVNRVPGILKPLYTGITDNVGRIPEGLLHNARELHERYYSEWREYPETAIIVQYEDAFADPEGFLEWVRGEYDLPRKADKWDLGDTWLEGPERERYLPNGLGKSWRGNTSQERQRTTPGT